jgi:hypothetical protein
VIVSVGEGVPVEVEVGEAVRISVGRTGVDDSVEGMLVKAGLAAGGAEAVGN